jgi:hypothetical protein
MLPNLVQLKNAPEIGASEIRGAIPFHPAGLARNCGLLNRKSNADFYYLRAL